MKNEPTLASDVEKRFNKEMPSERAVIRHVGKLHGMNFVSESIETAEQVDREKAKAFLASELDRQRRAYGGCEKCYGKGYSTELTSQTRSADFCGDKSQVTHLSNINPCSCDRGKQIVAILEMVTERQRQEYVVAVDMLTRYQRSIHTVDHSDGEPLVDMLQESDVLAILKARE